jgi:hypothetical protein
MTAFVSENPCYACGLPFTPAEWEDRHSDEDGRDVHADCCSRVGPCSPEAASTAPGRSHPAPRGPGAALGAAGAMVAGESPARPCSQGPETARPLQHEGAR